MGYVRPYHDANGVSPFLCVDSLVKFILHRAQTSTLHADVYLALPWASPDNNMSTKEGWFYYSTASTKRLWRLSSSPHTDETLHTHIQKAAERGSLLHKKLLLTVAKHQLLYGEHHGNCAP
jgi:hypothetical protein